MAAPRAIGLIWHRRSGLRAGGGGDRSKCQGLVSLSLEDARRLVDGYVDHYNNARLNSATGYITPKDMLTGRQQEVHAERDHKLEAAGQRRLALDPDPLHPARSA